MPKYNERLYFFRFGNHPLLSLAELINLLKLNNFKYKIKHRMDFGVLIEIARPEEQIADLQNSLGGTIKIIKIQDRFSGKVYDLEEHITSGDLVEDYFNITKGKVNYGLSVYADPTLQPQETQWLRNWVRDVKKALSAQYTMRYVESEGLDISSVSVTENNLLETGAELVLIRMIDDRIRSQSNFYFGKTLSVQDWKAYSHRDEDRPNPTPKAGMLPPKLAQMMINITRDENTEQIYDPFVGSGVVLQEAMVLGLDFFGSDIDEDAVLNAHENVSWAYEQVFGKEPRIGNHFKPADATKVRWKRMNDKSTIVVTEPNLGPPQRNRPRSEDALAILEELADLYIGFFENFSKNFEKVNRFGIILPVIKSLDGLRYMDILNKVSELGFDKQRMLPEEIMRKESQISRRGGFLYSRPDQIVLREFFVFEK